MAIVLLSWSGWQTASNSLNEEKYGVSLLVTVSLSCTLELMANRLQFSQWRKLRGKSAGYCVTFLYLGIDGKPPAILSMKKITG